MRYEQAHSFIHSFIRSFQVVCPASPPPLFFLLGIMGNDTTTTMTTTPHFSLTHTHIYTMCGTKYPIPSSPPPLFPPNKHLFCLLLAHKQKRQLCPRPPCVPPAPTSACRSCSYMPHPIFRRVGRSVGHSVGGEGWGCFCCLAWGESV